MRIVVVSTGVNRSRKISEAEYMILFFCLALFVYWGSLFIHKDRLFPQSAWPYFVYYAQALLDGHLYFTHIPPSVADLSFYHDRVYMHFPPFPAVLLMPFVKVFGLGMSGRFVCVLLAALNGMLFFKLLRRLNDIRVVEIDLNLCAALTVFYLFGTVHLYCAITSNPWEFAHIVCNFLVLCSLLLAVQGKYGSALVVYVAIIFTLTPSRCVSVRVHFLASSPFC